MTRERLSLTAMLAASQPPSSTSLLLLTLRLSAAAIMAQLATIMMEYIDASMVGSLGATAGAAIGLVISTTWLFGGLCAALSAGFSIQAAQHIGAGNKTAVRQLLKQALLAGSSFSALLAMLGCAVSPHLPSWLGASAELYEPAAAYFFIYCCALPFFQLSNMAGALLQSSGNMRLPSLINVFMCGLDVVLNMLLIFPAHSWELGIISIYLPGAGLGVKGAALGTALTEAVGCVLMLTAVCCYSPHFKLRRGDSWQLSSVCLSRAVSLAMPVGAEHLLLCSAMVMSTKIAAPLGAAALAANSFAVTAESLCYMPGYGIAAVAAPLVGQSLGAGRLDLVRRFARLTVTLGVAVMSMMSLIMYIAAPHVFAFLTVSLEVQELGIAALRSELWAEPLFAVSIVAAGALRGAGDTFIPSLLNIGSIWLIRLPLACWLVDLQ